MRKPDQVDGPRVGIILAGTALLLWPTVLNWHPYLFWDTYGYFLQGKAYARLLLAGLGAQPVPPEAAAGWLGAAGRMLAHDPSIRSATWSLLTYATATSGGFWLLAASSALVAAASVELALVRLFAVPPAMRLLVVAGLAAATSLPWFAGYLMPDLYAGLLILAAALLAFAWDGMRRGERLGVVALWTAALTFHLSHLLLGWLLAILAALLPGRSVGRGLRLALPACGAVALQAGLGWIGFGAPGLMPQSAPFLLARSWEDGPARAYLRQACPDAGWTICAQRDRLAPSAQDFLWHETDSYWASDLATRAALRAEELPILLRAVAADPAGQLGASLADVARQTVRFGLDDFVLGRGAAVTPDDYTFVYLPLAPAAVWGLGGFTVLLYAATAAGLLTLALLWQGGRLDGRDRQLVLFVLGALLLNAAVCGALSGPHARYQSRVVWLVPLLAAGLALSRDRAAPAPAAA